MIRWMGLEPVMTGTNSIDIVGEVPLSSDLIQKGHHWWPEIQEGPDALARVGQIEGAFQIGERCGLISDGIVEHGLKHQHLDQAMGIIDG